MVSFPRFDSNSRIRRLEVGLIDPNPAQPRRSFSRQSLEELAGSIRANGLLSPIAVRRTGDRYQLIAGERRLMAFRLLGESHIPAIIEQADDQRSAALAIVENLQRQQLNFYEEARAIATLMESGPLTQKQAAEQLGLSQPAVANKLRLLKLPEPVALMLIEAGAGERHARALLPLEGDRLLRAARQVAERRLSVVQTERLVEELRREPQPRKGGRIVVLKDFRLFTNSIERAVDLLRQAGVGAKAEKSEDGDTITYTITIPKQEVRRPPLHPCDQTPTLRSVF